MKENKYTFPLINRFNAIMEENNIENFVQNKRQLKWLSFTCLSLIHFYKFYN